MFTNCDHWDGSDGLGWMGLDWIGLDWMGLDCDYRGVRGVPELQPPRGSAAGGVEGLVVSARFHADWCATSS